MYQKILRPLLFQLPPEAVHQGTLRLLTAAGWFKPALKILQNSFLPADASPIALFGLTFSNRVGLAAGYDKDALAILGLAALGFGHIEVGTVTPLPQTGNPKPRLFRLPEDQAVINRMGFPGQGADAVARRLSRLQKPAGLVLGVNLGKNKDTPLDQAHKDYQLLVERFAPLTDYLAINISSPNTVGLRQLQHREFLDRLLREVLHTRAAQQDALGKRVPLLVKLAPDLEDREIEQIVASLLEHGIDGVIATNTTIQRPNFHSPKAGETGGLSGAPLKDQATRIIRLIAAQAGEALPIIGVGGIASPQDAVEKLQAGASLVQLYTGMIYQGPGLARQIAENL